MVEHLQDKPPTTNIDAWFNELKKTANLNPQINEERLTLNNLPALKVRYRNPDGTVMEEVYVVFSSKTFEVSFSGGRSEAIEKLTNYAIYLRMLSTFKVNGR
jgi:uncharacterized pyridoxamine 5'-phosphate oxidase family protein